MYKSRDEACLICVDVIVASEELKQPLKNTFRLLNQLVDKIISWKNMRSIEITVLSFWFEEGEMVTTR